MQISDFNCDCCIYNREGRCCEEKEYKSIPCFGCSKGSWVIKMLKWSGPLCDKTQPVHTVGWDWLARNIVMGEKFKLVKEISNEESN